MMMLRCHALSRAAVQPWWILSIGGTLKGGQFGSHRWFWFAIALSTSNAGWVSRERIERSRHWSREG